jgi:hypothetical protein
MALTSHAGFHDSLGNVRVIAEAERVAIGGGLGPVSRHGLAATAVVVGVDGPLRLRAERVHEGRAVLVRPGCGIPSMRRKGAWLCSSCRLLRCAPIISIGCRTSRILRAGSNSLTPSRMANSTGSTRSTTVSRVKI